MTTLNHQTDEALDRMLAELAGYRAEKWSAGGWMLYSPSNERISDCGAGTEDAVYSLYAPRYTQSLDECARVEAGLQAHQWSDYTMALRRIIQRDCDKDECYVPGCDRSQLIADIWFYCATARQRAEALIQTLQSTP